MKQPTLINKYCKACFKHQPQKVEKYKKGRVRTNTWINRQKKRYGKSQCLGKFNKVVKTSFKTAKRALFTIICQSCKHKNTFVKVRAKRVELIKK